MRREILLQFTGIPANCNFAAPFKFCCAKRGGCSRPNHGHTHLNSKVFRCCLNSNNNYYSQRISNIISGLSCLHVRGRCNISAVHFFVILHKPYIVYHIFSVIFTIFFYFVHILFIYNCYNNICLKENFS